MAVKVNNRLFKQFHEIRGGEFFLYKDHDDVWLLCLKYLCMHTIGKGTLVNAMYIEYTPGESIHIKDNVEVISCNQNTRITVEGSYSK